MRATTHDVECKGQIRLATEFATAYFGMRLTSTSGGIDGSEAAEIGAEAAAGVARRASRRTSTGAVRPRRAIGVTTPCRFRVSL